MLSITLRATPSFDAFSHFLEMTSPLVFWMRAFEALWAPWLGPGAPQPRLGGEK